MLSGGVLHLVDDIVITHKTSIIQSHLVEACLQPFNRSHRHLDTMSLSSDSSAGHVVTMD